LKRQYTRNREKMPDLLLTTIPKANIPAAVAYEDEANTFTQQQTIAKASEASASEVLAEYSVNDDSTSYLRVKNDITTDGHFAPTLHAYYSQGGNTKPGLHITGRILASQDSGTVPGLILSAATGGSAALTTRPVLDIQNATTSMLKVNADGSLTIDTNLKLDPTGLTGVRTFTFPDVTGQVTLNQAANTFTLAQTINKTAEASAAEIMLECKLSDETTGYARIKNNSTTDAVFVPTWSTLNNSGATQVGSFDQALITPGHDSGTVAVKVWDVRRSDLNAITVRPGYQWRIGGAEVLKVLVDGSLIIDTNIKLMSTGLSAERAFTFPDIAGEVMTLNGTQTGTNKTLTTPTLTTPTINGSKMADPATKTGAYTLTATDSIIKADASASAFSLTLPAAATAGAGTTYTIIRSDIASSTNLLTIDANASELIGGNLTYILYPSDVITIECDGAGWNIIGNSITITHPGARFRKGATPDRRYIAGMTLNSTLNTSTTGPVVNTLYAIPIYVAQTTKFDTIECEVTTLGSGSNLRLGIYRDDGNCYPGALMFDSGNISAASAGAKSATITAAIQIFQPGLYWLAYENSATVPQVRALPGLSTCMPVIGWSSPLGVATGGVAYSVAHTVGALPNPYTGSATIMTTSVVGAPIPAVALRAV
jgi:hypothetical protein